MMLSITSALICAAVLGLWFPVTRWLAIISAACRVQKSIEGVLAV